LFSIKQFDKIPLYADNMRLPGLLCVCEVFMGISQALVAEIVKRILCVAEARQIILFGSAATGEMSKDSDIDLLVLESAPGDTREESVRIRRAVRGLGYPFDIIVMAAERFEESKNVVGGIAYPANKYGKVIYEAA
jgi:predicted nucleotidyltransferase